MTRRRFSAFLLFTPVAAIAAEGRSTISGRLQASNGGPVLLKTEDGKLITLEGDVSTKAVLRDARVIREQFEAVGEWKSPDRFLIDPIHKKALFIRRGGELLVITYWCEICAIRTYAPGRCQCCQDETALDPRDPKLENTAP
ncbi:MAG: hypothetical protein IH602_10825 [Bryobacteraceae bacterium]|nr:hypothetical protein [Bryobacteraceae bacterium]